MKGRYNWFLGISNQNFKVELSQRPEVFEKQPIRFKFKTIDVIKSFYKFFYNEKLNEPLNLSVVTDNNVVLETWTIEGITGYSTSYGDLEGNFDPELILNCTVSSHTDYTEDVTKTAMLCPITGHIHHVEASKPPKEDDVPLEFPPIKIPSCNAVETEIEKEFEITLPEPPDFPSFDFEPKDVVVEDFERKLKNVNFSMYNDEKKESTEPKVCSEMPLDFPLFSL